MEHVLDLTDKAAEILLETIEGQAVNDAYLSVSVYGGGCSGLQYGLGLCEGEPDINELVFECKGIKIAVENNSLKYVKGSTIDYVETSMGGGFKVENPNELKSCGCGKSFATGDTDIPEATGCGSCTKY